MPETIFENRAVDATQSGFVDMKNFFMQRSPGAMGGMFSPIEVFSLPTPVFLDTLHTGLTKEDANALEFLYGSITSFTSAREVLVSYNREGHPRVQINGDKFPNAYVCCNMTFLWDCHSMGGASYISSNGLLLYAWERWRLEDLKIAGRGVELDTDYFYRGTANSSDIIPQLHRYPDLVEVLKEFRDEKEDAFDSYVEDVRNELELEGGSYSVYSGTPISPHQKRIMERYRVFSYFAEVSSSVGTLNQMVKKIKALVRVVEDSYIAARDMYRDMYAEESKDFQAKI